MLKNNGREGFSNLTSHRSFPHQPKSYRKIFNIYKYGTSDKNDLNKKSKEYKSTWKGHLEQKCIEERNDQHTGTSQVKFSL